MEHALVSSIQKALGWSGPEGLGNEFVRGALPDPGLCARIMNPAKLLDLIMRRSLDAPQLRCFQAGAEIHPARFLDDAVSRRGQGVRIANMGKISRLLSDGCTFVLDQVDFFDPTMEAACRALQWWSREVVQVNTYLTTQATDGFPLHWDDHEVLVVQLAGEKSWEVRGQSRIAPMYRDAVTNDTQPDEVLWSGTLKAGEVMHIPRGYWHRATRADLGQGFSLHATFGLTKRTGVHWLAWAADQSRGVEVFRHNLDRWGTASSRQFQEDELLAATRLSVTRSVKEFINAREQEQPADRHLSTKGVFGPPTAVVCVTAFPPHVEHEADRVIVRAAGKKITLSDKALPALRSLLSGAPVELAELQEQTGIDVDGLADVLVEEGLCAELHPELRSGYTDLVTSGVSSNGRLNLVSVQ